MQMEMSTLPPPCSHWSGKICAFTFDLVSITFLSCCNRHGSLTFKASNSLELLFHSIIVFRTAGEMDQADEELRDTIKFMWPLQGPKMIDLLIPPKEMLNGKNLTVGKIYAGLLILESWRSSRFGKNSSTLPVSLEKCLNFSFLKDETLDTFFEWIFFSFFGKSKIEILIAS